MSSSILTLRSSSSFSRQKPLLPKPKFNSHSPFSSTLTKFKSRDFGIERRLVVTEAIVGNLNVNFPLISPNDQWGNWTALFAAAAFGIWSEKTEIGKTVSGAIVSILVCLAASNLGIISVDAPAYDLVLKFLLPLAIPLLLFRADLRRVISSTGILLLPFLLGSGNSIFSYFLQ
jgi:hypothetical protein